jgi:hypothetical protein
MELFQRLGALLVLKFGIHKGQTGRKGVSRRAVLAFYNKKQPIRKND